MFKKIVVAYNESPEANRALASAIYLAKLLGADLRVPRFAKSESGHESTKDSDSQKGICQ